MDIFSLTITIGIILLALPVAFAGDVFMWRVYLEERRTIETVEGAPEQALPDPRVVNLAFILAAVLTAGTVAAACIAIPTLAFVLGAAAEVRRSLGIFLLLGIDILLVAMILPATYLWLRRRPGHQRERGKMLSLLLRLIAAFVLAVLVFLVITLLLVPLLHAVNSSLTDILARFLDQTAMIWAILVGVVWFLGPGRSFTIGGAA